MDEKRGIAFCTNPLQDLAEDRCLSLSEQGFWIGFQFYRSRRVPKDLSKGNGEKSLLLKGLNLF